MKKVLLLFHALCACLLLSAQTGTLDPTFGTGGFTLTDPLITPQLTLSLAKQGFILPNGKIEIVLINDGRGRICRRLSNGQLDTTYANHGYSDIVVMIPSCAALQPDQKIIVAGTVNGSNHFMLVRYNTDGTLDQSFGDHGGVITDIGSPSDFLNAIVLNATGKIIVGGTSSTGGLGHFVLAQYTASGTLDPSFGTGGIVTTTFDNNFSSLGSLALQPDGKIVAAGDVFENTIDFAIARYNIDGSLDTSFNSTGKKTSDYGGTDGAGSTVIHPNGKIYVGGNSFDPSNHGFRISRYNSDGTPDPSFNGGSVLVSFGATDDNLSSIRLQPDGKLLVVGRTNINAPNYDVELVRLNIDGSLDSSFGTLGNGLVLADYTSLDEAVFLAIGPDGKILAGGDSNIDTAPFLLSTCFRFNADGTKDTGFATSGVAVDSVTTVFSGLSGLLIQSDGRILTPDLESNGFEPSEVFLRRFNSNGTPDQTFAQNGTKDLGQATNAIFQPNGKLLSIYFPDTSHITITRYNADGSIDLSFGSNGTAAVLTASIVGFQTDGKILLGGQVLTPNNNTDILLARYNPDGSIDPSFGSGGSVQLNLDSLENLNSISVAPDGKIVLGSTSFTFPPDFSFFFARVIIARLNADGTIDTGFGINGKQILFEGTNDFTGSALALNDNKILVSYSVSFDNITNNSFIERLNTDGTVDSSFGTSGKISTDGTFFTLQQDQKILVLGVKGSELNNTDFDLSRFNSDGSPDPAFGTNGSTISSFTRISNSITFPFIVGNSLFVAGTGVDKNDQDLGIIAKYRLTGPTPGCLTINNLQVSPQTLFPPNHMLEDVLVNYTVTDNCDSASVQLSVSSNEPVQTNEPGDQSPDWQIIDNHHIKLRAERLGTGNGRVYTIKVMATDPTGNHDSASTTVNVPKSMGNPNCSLILLAAPNPSHSSFLVAIASTCNEKINARLLNNSGTVLATYNDLNPPSILRVGAGLAPGIYFFEAIQSGNKKTLKLIKQ